MTKKNDSTVVIDYETAQRFIADFHFLWSYKERNADDYNNSSPSPVFRDVFITAATSLLESSEMLLDRLYDAFPAEFSGYCSDKAQREMTEEEFSRWIDYVRN